MKDDDVEPDLVTYNTLIFALARAGMVAKARTYLDAMAATAPRATSRTLLMGLCKNKKLDKAMDVYKSMIAAGMKLEAPTYATFVRALCRAGRVPDAYEVFDYGIESKSFAEVTLYAELKNSLKWLRR
ncbi:hypothetical protein ABZP36_010477 [Zizania latifolia]